VETPPPVQSALNRTIGNWCRRDEENNTQMYLTEPAATP
jgi:hypothetical protein